MMNTKELIKAIKNERGSAFQNCNDCEYGTHNGEVIQKLNRLAELEDKIEQGTMKEFNDNLIGETVYGIHQDTTGKYYFENDEHTLLGFTSNGIVVWNDFHGYTDYFTDGFWFLNYKEAEKKFKELQE